MQHGSARSASYTISFTRCVAPHVWRDSSRAASERASERDNTAIGKTGCGVGHGEDTTSAKA
eukprot:12479258-Alexandrium_andersonii.AAC.1